MIRSGEIVDPPGSPIRSEQTQRAPDRTSIGTHTSPRPRSCRIPRYRRRASEPCAGTRSKYRSGARHWVTRSDRSTTDPGRPRSRGRGGSAAEAREAHSARRSGACGHGLDPEPDRRSPEIEPYGGTWLDGTEAPDVSMRDRDRAVLVQDHLASDRSVPPERPEFLAPERTRQEHSTRLSDADSRQTYVNRCPACECCRLGAARRSTVPESRRRNAEGREGCTAVSQVRHQDAGLAGTAPQPQNIVLQNGARDVVNSTSAASSAPGRPSRTRPARARSAKR